MDLGPRASTVRGRTSPPGPTAFSYLTVYWLAAALLILPAAVHAQEDKGPPSGTVVIQQVQIAFIGSGNLGGGTLTFNGKKYDFTVGGLGIGGIGVSKMKATGEVYGLKNVQDFAGGYVQGRYGLAAGDKSSGELWLQNDSGVSLHLQADRKGLALALGADAVYIGFD